MRKFLMPAVALAALALSLSTANAHDYKLGDLRIDHPWSRATPPAANVGAGYMTIHNDGAIADRLLGISSPAAKTVEVHSMTIVDGVMRMRPLPDGVTIDPGAEATLEPGGNHLMLIGLAEPLREGATVPVELEFEKAGKVTVELAVGPMGAPATGDHGSH